MKVNLIIKDDKALRKEIREMIKGQVLSFTRKELNKIVVDEFIKKVKADNRDFFIELAREEIRKILNKNYSWESDFRIKITDIIREDVVPGLVQKRLDHIHFDEKLMKQWAEEAVRRKFISLLAGLTKEEIFAGVLVKK
ncbi:hypothetical protein ES703_73364 [subsurface metagenome]